MTHSTASGDVRLLEELSTARGEILTELRKVIVGQDVVVEQLLTVLFANGHCLIVGVPGLAKTLLVSTLATILDLQFSRIQFTPDLMPSDITGTEILEEEAGTGHRSFKFIHGPIFANVVLADEINRTPPKTQAALLQAMQEYRVTAGGTTYPLSLPFFVLATQNPIEFEGTYPLPEAQLDRFMFHISVGYPSDVEEERIVTNTTSAYEAHPKKVLSVERIIDLQRLVRRIPVSEHVVRYAVRLARASRPGENAAPFVKDWVSWGAGPRAAQYLVLGAKARAALAGRPTPSADDVKAVAPAVLRHRIIPNFTAEADGISTLDIIAKLLEATPSVDGKHA
ncbi:MAG TPA: MoxR family ATPase [Candidatus Eisenbacteria bacterium]|nr:MoxR family ATPase [Candidatus Eisenbacteria bacterium]